MKIITRERFIHYLEKEFDRKSTIHEKTDTVMLYADLSGTDPAAMKEIVSTYKRYVAEEAVDEGEKIKPLHTSLLKVILNPDDNLQIVRIRL